MKFVSLEQGSENWKEYRRLHLTSTDASVVMGKNPFTSRKELWNQKMGLVEPKPINSKMARGTELEPIARDLLIKETGIEFAPAVVEHNEHSWISTSLDGVSPCLKYVAEIKCGSQDLHQFALEGGIYDYYDWQLVHHLLVTGCDKCYFASYRPEHTEQPLAIIEVLPDYENMAELFAAEKVFYEVNMKQFIAPEDYKINLRK